MLKNLGLFCVACLATAAAVESLSQAETYTVPSGQSQTVSTAVKKGSVVVNGGGTLNLTNDKNSYRAGTYVIQDSTVAVTENHALGALSGAIHLGDDASGGILDVSGSTKTVTADRPIILGAGGGSIVAGSNAWTLDGGISGTGALTIGGGTVILGSSNNTYSGGTVIDGGGTLQVNTDDKLGAANGGITLGNASTAGTIDFTNSSKVTSARGITVNPGGGIIDLSAKSTAWTFTGPLAGSGPLTIEGKGAFILDSVGSYSGTATIQSGTFQLGTEKSPNAGIDGGVTLAGGDLTGLGTIGGAVTNNAGTVAPGIGTKTTGTLTVGSYSQGADGTLALLVKPKNGDVLVVNNSADLNGNLQLKFRGQFRSTTIELVNAGSVNGSFSNVLGTLSASMQQQIVYTSTGVELVLTQLPTLPDKPTIYPALTSVGIDDSQAANGTVLAHIDSILNGAAVDDMPMARLGDHAAGYSPGNTMYGTWARGVGGWGSTGGSGGAPGYSVTEGGFTAGIDSQLQNPGIFLGAAIEDRYASISEKGGASGTVQTPRLMVYGGWWHDWLAIDGTLGLGEGMFDSRRPIAGAGSTSAASYTGYTITGALQANTNLHLGAIVITPALGAEYARLMNPVITEAGGPYDVMVKSADTDSLRPFAAATASTRILVGGDNLAIEPRLRVAIESEALGTARRISLQPVGDAQTFTVSGVPASRAMLDATAGVLVETSRDFGVFSDVGVIYSRNSDAASLDAGVRYRF